MATLIELASNELVVRLDPALELGELEERCIYVFPHVIDQIEAMMGMDSPTGHELSATEQFYEFLAHFASGGEMQVPQQFHDLRHRADGIWELKTRDLRFFGWFHQIDCFVCTDLADATRVKHGPPGSTIKGSLYHGYGNEVVRRRNGLNLDHPKFISGVNPQDVVSNTNLRQ